MGGTGMTLVGKRKARLECLFPDRLPQLGRGPPLKAASLVKLCGGPSAQPPSSGWWVLSPRALHRMFSPLKFSTIPCCAPLILPHFCRCCSSQSLGLNWPSVSRQDFDWYVVFMLTLLSPELSFLNIRLLYPTASSSSLLFKTKLCVLLSNLYYLLPSPI